MRVRFTPAAKQDLVDITRFIGSDNPGRADSFVRELVAACEALAEYPERHAVLPRYASKGYRRKPLGQYVIIYLVADEVRIMRVISSWVDLNAELD